MFQQTIDHLGNTKTQGIAYRFLDNLRRWQRIFIQIKESLLSIWQLDTNTPINSKPIQVISLLYSSVIMMKEQSVETRRIQHYIKVKLFQQKNSNMIIGFQGVNQCTAWLNAFQKASNSERRSPLRMISPNVLLPSNSSNVSTAHSLNKQDKRFNQNYDYVACNNIEKENNRGGGYIQDEQQFPQPGDHDRFFRNVLPVNRQQYCLGAQGKIVHSPNVGQNAMSMGSQNLVSSSELLSSGQKVTRKTNFYPKALDLSQIKQQRFQKDRVKTRAGVYVPSLETQINSITSHRLMTPAHTSKQFFSRQGEPEQNSSFILSREQKNQKHIVNCRQEDRHPIQPFRKARSQSPITQKRLYPSNNNIAKDLPCQSFIQKSKLWNQRDLSKRNLYYDNDSSNQFITSEDLLIKPSEQSYYTQSCSSQYSSLKQDRFSSELTMRTPQKIVSVLTTPQIISTTPPQQQLDCIPEPFKRANSKCGIRYDNRDDECCSPQFNSSQKQEVKESELDIDSKKEDEQNNIENVLNRIQQIGVIIPNSLAFQSFLSQNNIPLNCLGDLAVLCKEKFFKEMCWIELISLISVKYFNQIFKNLKKPGNAVIQTLNTILGSNDDSTNFWKIHVPQLSDTFFTNNHLLQNFSLTNLKKQLSSNALLLSIQFNLGVQLKQKIYNYDSSSPFTLQDIETLDLIFLSRILQLSTLSQSIQSSSSSSNYSNINEFSSINLDKNYNSTSLRTDTVINHSLDPKLDLNPLQLLNLNNQERKLQEIIVDFSETESHTQSIDQTLSELMSCISQKVTQMEQKHKQKQAKKRTHPKFKTQSYIDSNNNHNLNTSYTEQFIFHEQIYSLINCAQLNFHQRAKSGLLLYKFAVAFLNSNNLNESFMCCEKYLIEQRVDSVTALINSIKMVLQFRKGDVVAAINLYNVAKNQIIYQFCRNHPLQIFVDMLLADCYYSRGNLFEARKYYENAYKIAKQTFGTENQRVEKCRLKCEKIVQRIREKKQQQQQQQMKRQ